MKYPGERDGSHCFSLENIKEVDAQHPGKVLKLRNNFVKFFWRVLNLSGYNHFSLCFVGKDSNVYVALNKFPPFVLRFPFLHLLLLASQKVAGIRDNVPSISASRVYIGCTMVSRGLLLNIPHVPCIFWYTHECV